jgi:hypothetical protein
MRNEISRREDGEIIVDFLMIISKIQRFTDSLSTYRNKLEILELWSSVMDNPRVLLCALHLFFF